MAGESKKIVIGVKPLQKKALNASNNPSDVNAVATMADVLAGSGGNRIITGSASYSGVGLTYDVTALTYIIQGTLYASLATQVTLAAADPTDPRIDVILVDTLGAVSVLTGTPAPVPSKPTVDNLTEVEITFVSVPAGATSPPIVIETIYDEDLGSGSGEWDATTDGTVLLASVADPYQGTVSIETNPTLGPNKKISLMPGAPYTINGGQLSFWLQAKSDMTSSSDAFYIGFFNSGVLEGNAVTIAGSPAISFGFDPSIVGSYQLVTIPIAAFGGLSATIDELRFFKLGGASTSEFFLDDIQIEEGIPTPPTPIEGHEVYDETTALTQRPKIRFLGAGVTATDNPSENATDVTVNSGAGGSNFSEVSGLIDGGVLSINGGDNTKFDLSAGTGQVVDAATTPATPSITPVTIVGGTAITVTDLGTQFFTYILVDDLGAIVQQGNPPTSEQLRTHIYIGKLNHANQLNLVSAVNAPSLAIGTSSALEDLMLEAIGVINATPMVVSSGGANLNIDISAGDLWQLGINYDGDKNKPHTLSYATYDSSVVPFVYVLSDTTIIGPNNVLIPGSYESPLGTVTAVGVNNWTNQRVYKTLTGDVLVMYGQTQYNSKALALEGLYSESHVTPDILTSGEAILIGIITINQGATDTSNSTEAVFQQASKFGEFGKGSAGVSTGNLQNAYENSIEPEITTDDARGPVSIKRGTTGGDTDIVYEVLNGAGDVVATVDGEGTVDSGGVFNSTGLFTGGVLQAGTGGFGVTTLFSITDGSGQIVDSVGKRTKVSWTGLTDLTITNLATNLITFIAIDSLGAVIQQTSPFTPTQARTHIVLGVLVHVNFTVLDTVNNEQEIAYNPMSSLHDAMQSIGFFNIRGNVFEANGANLNIDKSVGDMFKMGSNYDTDINNPHVRNLAAYTVAPFQYRFSDGTSGTLGITAVDPDNLDDGAGGLTAISANRWSIQRIYVFTSNNVKIQRGVSEYTTLEAAIAGIATEPYITEPSIAANGLFRGWMIVKQGATVLNGADAQFLSAPKFGEGNAGATGSSSDLQTAYDNSIANPEVLTNSTNGAMTVRRGSALDTDNIYEGQNNAGTTNFAVTGEGKVSGTDFNGVPLTTAGVATKYLDEQGNYTTPAGGGTSKFNMNTYAYNYVGASTTAGNEWNSVSVGAVGATEWNDRWRVASFVGTGGADGFYINLKLPSTYIAGTDIRVIMPFSTLTGGAGNVHIGCGLTQPIGAGGGFGSETETEWLTQQVAMLAAAAVTDATFTFDGTTLSPGDDLSVMVYRDPGNAQDTLNDTIYNPVILIEEV